MGNGFPNLFLDFEYEDAQDICADVLSGVDDGDLAPPDDVEAVKYWLSTIKKPHAFNQHRMQVERFLHFLIRVKKKTHTDLEANDVADYYAFATNPEPKEEWVSNVHHVAYRASKHWRPFRVALGQRAVDVLRTSIKLLVLWLQKIEYVQEFDVIQRADGPRGNLLDSFTAEQWELLKLYIETLHTGDNAQDVGYHRKRWLLQLVYLGGLSTTEINQTPMCNFSEPYIDDGVACWQLTAVTARTGETSRGLRKRIVFVGPDFLNELKLYRISLGLPALPMPKEDWYLLVPERAKTTGVRFQQPKAREVMKAIIDGFSMYLRCNYPNSLSPGQRIEKANTAWLRRTVAKQMCDNGTDFSTVCKFFGVTQNSRLLRQLRPSAQLALEQLALKHRSTWPTSRD